jgi:hypothetical protein
MIQFKLHYNISETLFLKYNKLLAGRKRPANKPSSVVS